jgi:2-(1,2-epoxy-1,2-dihydrophenyl)acetyl-CoA isomerase
VSGATEAAVALRRDGAVATIELTRADRRNAWGPELGAGLAAALHEVAADRDVRAVVLTGGRSFCSGADLTAGMLQEDLADVLSAHFEPAIRAQRALPQPLVAAVRGMAIGAGWTLALGCDLVVAADDARFSLPFTRLGLAPDVGTTALLPALVGRQRAAELVLLTDPIDAATAHAWGLANRVVPDGEVEATAQELAGRLAANAPLAIAATRRLLDHPHDAAFEAALGDEAEVQSQLGRTQDLQEALAAFRERRPAQFRGT